MKSPRFLKVCALGLALEATLLTGCTVTPSGALPAGAASYTVCSGGHASRFPSREEVGRVCQQSSSLRAIY